MAVIRAQTDLKAWDGMVQGVPAGKTRGLRTEPEGTVALKGQGKQQRRFGRNKQRRRRKGRREGLGRSPELRAPQKPHKEDSM